MRLSERRFYQKITDICATSVDYNKDAPTTQGFLCQGPEQAALFYQYFKNDYDKTVLPG
jgi:hypothetical protein